MRAGLDLDGLRGPFAGGLEIARLGIGGSQRAEDVVLLVFGLPAGVGRQGQARWPSRSLSSGAVARTQAKLLRMPTSWGWSFKARS